MAGEDIEASEERECAAGDQPMNDYEKERLKRIRENEARLRALGIRRLAASSLLRSPPPSAAGKGKRKNLPTDADEEYLPSDGGEEGEEEESSSTSEQDDEEDIKSSSRSRKKGKKKMLNSGKSSEALQQAIALSLAESLENSVAAMRAETSSTGMEGSDSTPCKKNDDVPIQDSAKIRKIKKQGKSRIQLTEDDVVAFFFSFDEVGKGYITPWDLERMATVHDFIWTDSEISKMIHCFDSDRDGKINLEDFRTIVSRCNMLQEPGKC
ncbi:hypothetical protein GUJ93_ZPchr0014g46650 [Zizania palustris]|uniref:EF-hand domain-containing protein n=1 Tax=Zizania palustris TaxID=103762 RepID=A0A8J5SXJ9_ZIZPA|nr:hypothetical protein GUJ93_ZPchr0014g46650 [Zizania palustris]